MLKCLDCLEIFSELLSRHQQLCLVMVNSKLSTSCKSLAAKQPAFGCHRLHFHVENNGVQLRSILNSSHPFFQAISETFFHLGSAQSLFERNFHKAVFLSHVFGESLYASFPRQTRGCFPRVFTHVKTSGRLLCSHVFKQTAPVCALDLEEVNRTKLGTECTQVQ